MIKQDTPTYVIDLTGDVKDAALYFDAVVPLSFGAATAVEFQSHRDSQFIRQISPDSLYTSVNDREPCEDYIQAIDAMRAALYFQIYGYTVDECRPYQEAFGKRVIQIIETRPELHGAALLLPERDPFPGMDARSEFLVTLTGLSLVDTEKASWDQILTFRQDERSRMAFRRLQILAAKEYSGKDQAYIKDDLLLRIEAYNNAVRDWGFETRIATLSNLLGSKTLLGGLGGALLAALLGKHWAAAASAATGITVELGNIAIDLVKRHYSLETLRRDHPLNYIISARKLLS